MKFDYIIVGNGIAGSVLSYMLLQRKKKILVIDKPSLSSSSQVAAGLYNPIVFKRLAKSWNIDVLLPFADKFYSDAESFFGEKLYHKKNILKIFSEENEIAFWKKKAEEIPEYLLGEIDATNLNGAINNPLGMAAVKQSGWLDIKKFIAKNTEHLKKNNSLLNEKFDYSAIQFSEESISYKNSSASKIIFCEGFLTSQNPFFKWLPFKLTKGETLTIKIKDFPTEQIINKGVFILPLGKDLFKVGATYEWDELDEVPTEKGKSELISKLGKVFKTDYEIISHEAGIRPTVKDRRPLIGIHPQYSHLVVFNGMGTKGVLLAPYYAQKLAEHLEKNIPLEKEADISRFNLQ
jgi:glycine oxidase